MQENKAVACKTILATVAALALTACVAYESQPLDDVPGDEPGTVWVTIGADARDVVQEAIERGAIVGTFHPAADDGPVLVLEIERRHLAALTELMHVEFNRCSGYSAHDSFKEAASAYDPEKVAAAMNKTVTYNIDNEAAVSALLPTISQSNIVSTISYMSTQYTNRYHTTSNGTAAALWLRDTWRSYANASGRYDVTVELYYHNSTSQPSVIMTIPGDWSADEVVVIGGHLDSTAGGGTGPNTPAPGADDNASGIATVSEVARVLLTEGFFPDRTVKFMAYAAEEVGLRGSAEIADDFAAQGIDVVGVLQLDMTNYHGSSQDIALIADYTNGAQNAFIGDLIDAYFPALVWTYSSCGYSCSDHASWTAAGYAASIAFESQVGQHNPYIHTSQDTLAHSDSTGAHAMKFARLATAYVAELAKGDFTDDWTPPSGATTELLPDALGVYETHHYGPFSAQASSSFTARLDSVGYADVYVRFGAPPTTTEYNCRPYSFDALEECDLVTPAADVDIYVMVRGFMASYTLKLAYFDSAQAP